MHSPYGTETLLCCLPWQCPPDARRALSLAGFTYRKGARINGKGGWYARRTRAAEAVCIWLEDARHAEAMRQFYPERFTNPSSASN